MVKRTPDVNSVNHRWWRDDTGEQGRRRAAKQAELLQRNFNRGGGRRAPRIDVQAPNGEIEYFHRNDVVLTRDRDAAEVYRALGMRMPTGRKSIASTPAGVGGLHVVPVPRKWGVHASLQRLDDTLGVGVATPDHVIHICDASSCPATEPIPAAALYPEPAINPQADADGRLAKIVVVDTGLLRSVVSEHDWLSGVTGTEEPERLGHYRGHGTFIAGVIRSMAPAAEVHVEALAAPAGAVLESDLAPALERVLSLSPDIISMSAGTRTRDNRPLLSLQVFYEERLKHLKGTVLVCAAGNDSSRDPFWPAAFPWSVSVGALNTRGLRAGYSNYGSWVDVFARGSGIVNAYPTGKYRYEEPPREGLVARFDHGMAAWSGTSFSTPIVAGLIAARMTWSGESARQSAEALLHIGRDHAVTGVGAVLQPGDCVRAG